MGQPFRATAMPDRDWWSELWPRPHDVLDRMGLAMGMVALDLCCGDGYFTAPLARLLAGEVYAVDIDPDMIAQARAAVAEQGAAVKGWLCADACQVASLLPQQVDYVFIANSLHGVPDQPGFIRMIRSVLKPGAILGLVNWHVLPREECLVLGAPRGPRTDMRLSPQGLEALAVAQGFSCRKMLDLPPYHYGMIFQAPGGQQP